MSRLARTSVLDLWLWTKVGIWTIPLCWLYCGCGSIHLLCGDAGFLLAHCTLVVTCCCELCTSVLCVCRLRLFLSLHHLVDQWDGAVCVLSWSCSKLCIVEYSRFISIDSTSQVAADTLDHKSTHLTKWFRSRGSRYLKSAGERKLESGELKTNKQSGRLSLKAGCGNQAFKLEPSLLEEVEILRTTKTCSSVQ